MILNRNKMIPNNIIKISPTKGFGLFTQNVYKLKNNPLDHDWYFTVSVSYPFNNTAAFCCDVNGCQMKHGLSYADIAKLKSVIHGIHLDSDSDSDSDSEDLNTIVANRVFLIDVDQTDETFLLWKMAGPEYSKHAHFIKNGTDWEESLLKLDSLTSASGATKADIKQLFDELFQDKLVAFQKFIELSKTEKEEEEPVPDQ